MMGKIKIKDGARISNRRGIFYCSVPIPERKNPKATIHGKLYKLDDLKKLFENKNFNFKPLSHENGTLLYFKAKLKLEDVIINTQK
jgi:hypothetical protein